MEAIGVPDAALRDAVVAAVQAISPMPDADAAALVAIGRRRRLARGEVLTRAGDLARQAAVVLNGGLREYYELPDGTERTKGFTLPGAFAGSLADLLASATGEVSTAWVVAEAPSEILALPWDRYVELVDSRPAWALFARRLAERLYVQKSEREYELLALNAAERYRRALARYPGLEDVFRLHHVASYVGVTPQHLSRLRAGAAFT
jgi:CRP-like cAMP-binding protein